MNGLGSAQDSSSGVEAFHRTAGRTITDRFALAGKRGITERQVPIVGRKRTILVKGVHLLVLFATIAGGLRGFLFPGPTEFADPRNRVKKGLA